MMSPPAEHAVTETLSANTAALVVVLVCLPVLFVPAEEILFRGVIQTRLKGVWSQRSSIAIAALIFTLIHAPAFAGPGMGAALIVVGISGLALGVALEWTNSLVTPILLHTTYNVAVLLPLLL
jgi:membrane protease YdiL (CAAX protease family)